MPLSMIQQGNSALIVDLLAGSELKSRLHAMGLIPGTVIDVVHNAPCGPFIIQVKGTQLILGRGMAQQIMVS